MIRRPLPLPMGAFQDWAESVVLSLPDLALPDPIPSWMEWADRVAQAAPQLDVPRPDGFFSAAEWMDAFYGQNA